MPKLIAIEKWIIAAITNNNTREEGSLRLINKYWDNAPEELRINLTMNFTWIVIIKDLIKLKVINRIQNCDIKHSPEHLCFDCLLYIKND